MSQDYNCENLPPKQRYMKLLEIRKEYGTYSQEAKDFEAYLVRLDMQDTESRGMPDVDGPSAVNGHDYNAPGVSYSVIIMHDYWSEGRVADDGSWVDPKHYDVIYKIVYGPFATKGQALNNKEKANRKNAEVGLQEDCWVPEPKYLGGKKWYVQVAALGDLDKINDMLGKLGFKKIADEQPKQKEVIKQVEQKPVPVPDVKPVIKPAPYDPAMLNQLFNDYQNECAKLHDLIARAKTIYACDFAESDYKVVQSTKEALDAAIKYAKTMNFDTKDYEADCLGDVPGLLKAKRDEIANQYDPTNLKSLFDQVQDKCAELHSSIAMAKTIADCDNNDNKYKEVIAVNSQLNDEINKAKAKNFDTTQYVMGDCLDNIPSLLSAKRKEIEDKNKPVQPIEPVKNQEPVVPDTTEEDKPLELSQISPEKLDAMKGKTALNAADCTATDKNDIIKMRSDIVKGVREEMNLQTGNGDSGKISALQSVCEKLATDPAINAKAQEYYTKILNVLNVDVKKHKLSFADSLKKEKASQFVYAATLAVAWAYISVNSGGSLESQLSDKLQSMEQATGESDLEITLLHYNILMQKR